MKKIIKLIIAIIMLVLSLLCFKYVSDMDILPSKYLYLFLIIILALNGISILLLFIKGIISKIFSGILYILLAIISIVGIKYSKDTINFLDNSFSNNKEVITYNVIVSSNSTITKIEDLNNTIMGYLFLDIDDDSYLEKIKEKVSVELKETDIYGIYDGLLNNEINSILINEAYLDMLEEEYKDFSEKTKVIYSFNIEKEKEEEKEVIEKLEPINIYLSGSDSRSGYVSASSRSDVNMILTINPNTHTILLTNIPRDYYVQLHGTTGLKDKLTHAGIYGTDMSIKTIEDLLDIKISYSVKVGFSSVIKLVDLVGGVDIYSDTTFTSHCGDGGAEKVKVFVGMNHFTGAQALSYARERYAYIDGDNHRGRNQQQVIEAVIKKVMTNKSLLLKYDSLLSSFSDLYRTDIPKELITMLIKQQLDDMPSWEVISQQVTGYGATAQTYSMPGWNLYVMIPDTNSVETAVSKIKEVINPTEQIVEENLIEN